MPTPPLNTGTSRGSNANQSVRPLVGISFPFRKEDGEFPKRSRNADCVKDDIIMLFRQARRCRIMRPEVGTNANDCVFESQGGMLNARLQRSVRQTMTNNERRAGLQSATITTNDRQVIVDISYVFQGVVDTVQLDPFAKAV